MVCKESKLTGELANVNDATAAKRPITKVEETASQIKIYFESRQGGEVSIDLDKVDENNLKGSISGFDATAKRMKE